MSHDLSQEFLRVVEEAAIASARTMGKGEGDLADHVAVEAMRHEMDGTRPSTDALHRPGRLESPRCVSRQKLTKQGRVPLVSQYW